MSATLDTLAAITAAAPTRRKLLVSPSMLWGRETLASLARRLGGWIGWAPATLGTLADDVAYVPMARARQRRASSIACDALLEAAIADVAGMLDVQDDLVPLLPRPGVRDALRRALDALALADVAFDPSRRITSAAYARRWQTLCRIGRAYRERLSSQRLLDRAGVLETALRSIEEEWDRLGGPLIVLAGLEEERGLSGRWCRALADRGAVALRDLVPPADPLGAAPPRVDAFVAATPVDEVREVLRRAVAEGVPLDQVELIATDDDTYAIALEGVCTALDVHASMARGMPMAATSVGRRALRSLERLVLGERDGPAEVARALLRDVDAYDVTPDSVEARNRDAIAAALRACQDAAWPTVHPDVARATVRTEITLLRGTSAVSTSDRRTRSTAVRTHTGALLGRVHLTTLALAGASGRRWRAVVGLDAERTAGPSTQSAVLPDGMCAALSPELATITSRRAARTRLLNQALARAHDGADVTLLSYAVQSLDGERESAPSTALLHAVRAADPTITGFAALRAHLGAPVGAVPRRPGHALDARDAWLSALHDGRLFLDGSHLVRRHHPALAAGLDKRDALVDPGAAALFGAVPAAAGAFDPRRTGRPISVSALETLGECATKWFYQDVLALTQPEVTDASEWLDAASRGKLLHAVFRKIARHGVLGADGGTLETRLAHAMQLTDAVLARWRADRPPPSAGAFARDADAVRADVHVFVRSEVREAPAVILETELYFGDDGRARLSLADGRAVTLRGGIDRVDALEDGTLRVIDYKTGRVPITRVSSAPFDGGRRLQLPLYAAAAEQVLGRPVSQTEYRYPTRRGGGARVTEAVDRSEALTALVDDLLDATATGMFLPTDNKTDCGYCAYQAICDVRADAYGGVESPRAEWAGLAAQAEMGPHALKRQARRREST
ncbi:MAG: PD-(D/E)XK nuclease family protein [Gemmatimonadaceae bacterium]|nr:PD-(D/E)XK nuclease family protein [Gemmatimonadaceae bacterium]